jgi:gamma-glutamyltranspeptidase/glutathione hydrolase
MTHTIDRRQMLKMIAGTSALGLLGCRPQLPSGTGVVVGQAEGAEVGRRILAEGGNAVDAIVAAALTAGVVDIQSCGIAGYGGHMTIAMAGRRVTAIDFNSIAPASARHDMFVGPNGEIDRNAHQVGWLSAGVPGTLGGMQLALDRYGTKSLRQVLGPAIEFAAEGVPLSQPAVRSIEYSVEHLRRDPASANLLLIEGEPPTPGITYRNVDLAAMLTRLSEDNSVESFYRGDIGRQIAAEFERNGGLVTAEDMAAYEARVVEPIRLDWLGQSIYTAPLTAGGATVMETLSILRALDENGTQLESPHARLEALRIAWDDRLRLFGDPEHSEVPIDRLLSEDYAQAMAARVAEAVETRQPLDLATPVREQHGTIHLSAADGDGNFVALTLTHGAGFGAKVTVAGLGLTLGHGVSRFVPNPGHPNSPGPRKRPLHNMCPTVVVENDRPWLALGGRGARRIPNSVFDVLCGILSGDSVRQAMDNPRMHTTGNLDLRLEDRWAPDQVTAFTEMGYDVQEGRGATVSTAYLDSDTGSLLTSMR